MPSIAATTRIRGDVTILDLALSASPGDGHESLVELVHRLEQQDRLKILLNCRHLRYINAEGLGEIVNAYLVARESGGELRMCCLQRQSDGIYKPFRFPFDLDSSEEESLRRFGAES